MENKKLELLKQFELDLSKHIKVWFRDLPFMMKHNDEVGLSFRDLFISVSYWTKANCTDIYLNDLEVYVNDEEEFKDAVKTYFNNKEIDKAETLSKVYGVVITYKMLFKMIDNSF